MCIIAVNLCYYKSLIICINTNLSGICIFENSTYIFKNTFLWQLKFWEMGSLNSSGSLVINIFLFSYYSSVHYLQKTNFFLGGGGMAKYWW